MGSDPLTNIHGICVICRGLNLDFELWFKVNSGLLREGGMSPAGEQDKTKNRRETEKVFLFYH